MTTTPGSERAAEPSGREVGHDELGEACADAFAAYRRSLGARYDWARAEYAAGRVWEMAGRPAEALEAFGRVLEAADAQAWPRLLNAAARCARATGAEAATAEWLERRSQGPPPLPALDLWCGSLFRSAGDLDRAAAALARCIDRVADPALRHAATLEQLEVLSEAGRLDEALALCRAAVDWFPEQRAALRTNLGGLLVAAERPEDALAEVDGVLDQAPDWAGAHLVRGLALSRLGRSEASAAAIAEALRLDPGLVENAAGVLEAAP